MKNLILFTTSFILLMAGSVCAQNITYSSPWHYVNSPHGYISLGPANGSGAHIYTNKDRFYFNKPVWAITGEFSAYSTKDLKLQTRGITQMTILESNGNVGIGTSSPSTKLDVDGRATCRKSFTVGQHNDGYRGLVVDNGASYAWKLMELKNVQGTRMTVLGNGNVGIGTASPAEKLHINGSIRGNQAGALRISTGDGYVDVGPKNTSAAHFVTDRPIFYFNKEIRVNSGLIGSHDEDLSLCTQGTTRMTILKSNGKVRIGNSSFATPGDYKLYVEKGILTEKVKVAGISTSDWADFVFEEDYDLNSTAEVEDFINQNGHLPNVPSALEVSKNGVDMVEMDATLLRQIEELWLHLIELKKENEALKIEVTELKK